MDPEGKTRGKSTFLGDPFHNVNPSKMLYLFYYTEQTQQWQVLADHIKPLPVANVRKRLSAVFDEVMVRDNWWLTFSPLGVTSWGRDIILRSLRMCTAGVSNCLMSTTAWNGDPQLGKSWATIFTRGIMKENNAAELARMDTFTMSKGVPRAPLYSLTVTSPLDMHSNTASLCYWALAYVEQFFILWQLLIRNAW